MRQTCRPLCLFLKEESKKKMYFPVNEKEKMTIRNDEGVFFKFQYWKRFGMDCER